MANIKDFISATIQNGGASFNPVTGVLNPKRGYMVSIKGHEKVLPWPATSKQLQSEVAKYIGENATLLMSGITDDNKWLGSWVDTKNNTLVLDVSINDLQGVLHALGVAKREGQRYIWDNDRQMAILVS